MGAGAGAQKRRADAVRWVSPVCVYVSVCCILMA